MRFWVVRGGGKGYDCGRAQGEASLREEQEKEDAMRSWRWLAGAAMAAGVGLACAARASGAGWGGRLTREELAYMPATVQIELFKQGYVTPTDVLEAQISRAEEFNGAYNEERRDLKDELETFNAGKVNAITFDRFAEARAQAKEAAERYRNGTARRLEGVTVAVKGDCKVAGWRTDMGSLLLKDVDAADHDDAYVAHLRAEGAIFPFQTTVPEFCGSCMTWSRLYGVTRNPWNLPYGAGGSSGGSAAALAAGFCTLATGSDMGGSIRIPASQAGVYGFKPPFGRVPCCESSYMGYGPLARTFADMVLLQDVMAGPADDVHGSIRPKLDYPADYAPIRGEKVAVATMEEWLPEGCDADVLAALDEAVAALERAGAEVVPLKLGWKASELRPPYLCGILTDEVYLGYSAYRENRELMCPYLGAFFDSIGQAGPEAVVAAHALQSKLMEQLQREVFRQGCLALVMPTMATAHVPAAVESTQDQVAVVNGAPYKGLDFCMTTPFNLMNNFPVATVPVGFSARHVPIGVQVVGNTFDDLAAFRVAAALSKVLPQNFRDGRFPDFRSEK